MFQHIFCKELMAREFSAASLAVLSKAPPAPFQDFSADLAGLRLQVPIAAVLDQMLFKILDDLLHPSREDGSSTGISTIAGANVQLAALARLPDTAKTAARSSNSLGSISASTST
jgi:hypothetical protein